MILPKQIRTWVDPIDKAENILRNDEAQTNETTNTKRARTLGSDNFLEVDNVRVFESLEDFDLPDSGNRESIFLLFSVDALQSDNFAGLSILPNENAPKGRSCILQIHQG